MVMIPGESPLVQRVSDPSGWPFKLGAAFRASSQTPLPAGLFLLHSYCHAVPLPLWLPAAQPMESAVAVLSPWSPLVQVLTWCCVLPALPSQLPLWFPLFLACFAFHLGILPFSPLVVSPLPPSLLV